MIRANFMNLSPRVEVCKGLDVSGGEEIFRHCADRLGSPAEHKLNLRDRSVIVGAVKGRIGDELQVRHELSRR